MTNTHDHHTPEGSLGITHTTNALKTDPRVETQGIKIKLLMVSLGPPGYHLCGQVPIKTQDESPKPLGA